jgi:hypothetical protein
MKTGACRHVEGYLGGQALCFHAEVSGRQVGVEVPMATMSRLAEIMRHTNHSGHIGWHMSSDAPLPCESCRIE